MILESGEVKVSKSHLRDAKDYIDQAYSDGVSEKQREGAVQQAQGLLVFMFPKHQQAFERYHKKIKKRALVG